MRRRWVRWVALFAALSILGAACGSDRDDEAASPTTTTAPADTDGDTGGDEADGDTGGDETEGDDGGHRRHDHARGAGR